MLAKDKSTRFATFAILKYFSKIQLVVYYQCCVLISRGTTRLYAITP